MGHSTVTMVLATQGKTKITFWPHVLSSFVPPFTSSHLSSLLLSLGLLCCLFCCLLLAPSSHLTPLISLPLWISGLLILELKRLWYASWETKSSPSVMLQPDFSINYKHPCLFVWKTIFESLCINKFSLSARLLITMTLVCGKGTRNTEKNIYTGEWLFGVSRGLRKLAMYGFHGWLA